MSAPRPRPVTATINHKSRKHLKELYRAEPNLTSSSGGSTDSLVSCIDNYSLGNDTSDECEKENQRRQHSEVQPHSEGLSKSEDSNTNLPSKITATSSTLPSESEKTACPTLGAWEKWMLHKTEQLKVQALLRAREVKAKQREEKQHRHEQEEKKIKAIKDREEWLRRKNEEHATAERRQQIRQSRKDKEEAEKRRAIEEKANEKFQTWLQEKKRADSARRHEQAKRDKERELELEQKKQRSDEAFQAWLAKAASRQQLNPQHQRSYAKCDGVINGYYDKSACLSPSYYNPIPWQPVALPIERKAKPKRKEKRTARNAWSVDC